MQIPATAPGKFVLLLADLNTGIVLNALGEPYSEGEETHARVAGNMEEAEELAETELRKGTVEVLIYDHSGKLVKVLRPALEKL